MSVNLTKNTQSYKHTDKNFNRFLKKELDLRFSVLTSSLGTISCLNPIAWIFAKIFRREELSGDAICENIQRKIDGMEQTGDIKLLSFDQRATAMLNLHTLKDEFKTNRECVRKIDSFIESFRFENIQNTATKEIKTPYERSLNKGPSNGVIANRPSNVSNIQTERKQVLRTTPNTQHPAPTHSPHEKKQRATKTENKISQRTSSKPKPNKVDIRLASDIVKERDSVKQRQKISQIHVTTEIAEHIKRNKK